MRPTVGSATSQAVGSATSRAAAGRPDIVVPDDFPSVFERTEAHTRLKTLGDVRVFTARGADDEAELIRRIDRARAAINIRAHARFTEGVFAACRRLEMVSIWGTGTDNVDLEAAGRHGVTVTNTPGVNALAVAEHAIALALATARHIPRLDREVRAGRWPRELLGQLLGKTLGVAGMGRIGARVAELGRALGMTVLGWSATGDSARILAAGARPVSKDELLAESDVLSLHLRLVPATRGFLGRRELGRLRPTAVLVNTARGALVDRDALVEALGQGRLAGAGLDVFHDEPLRPGDPLLALPNVVLSPHNAGQTPEVIGEGLARAVDNVANFLAGRPTDVVVAPVR